MMKPKIRFNGFIDDWEQRKLGDILDVRSGRDYKHLLEGSIPVYGTGGYMLSVNEALSYDEDAIGIGRKGTIDKPYILKAPFWTVDTLFYAVPRHKTDLNFTFGIFQNIDWKKKDESTGVPSLSKTAINEIDILFPEYKEQQSIGRFFSNLDNLITLHQRKCDELKKLKKYMLQNMFPQNGENTPKIRFQGFINAWEQRKLGNMADIVGGGTPSTSISEFWDGDIDWYAPAEIADQIYLSSSQRKITEQGFNHSSTKMLPVGSVLFTSRAGIGKTAILSRQGCTNQGFQSIVPHKGELDSYFIFSRTEELKRYGETVGAGSTFVEVSSKQMANMELMMPKSLIEQKTIGEYFASIDNLITLHQRKYNLCNKVKVYAWEQRKLGEVAIYRRGSFPQPYGKSEWYDGEEAKPFVQVADVTDAMNLVDDTKQKISKLAQPMSVFAEKGSVLVTLQGSIGRVAITQYGAFVDRTVLIFEKYKTEIDNLFWAYVIKQKFIEEAYKAPGGTIKTITKEALSDFDLLLPNFNEQKQIGKYFSNLDNLITLHQRKKKYTKKLIILLKITF